MTNTFIKFMSEGKSKLESHSWKLEKTLIYVTLSCQDTTKVLGLGGWPGHIVFWQGTLISYELGEIIEVNPKVSLPKHSQNGCFWSSRVKRKNLKEKSRDLKIDGDTLKSKLTFSTGPVSRVTLPIIFWHCRWNFRALRYFPFQSVDHKF